ncbi:MAG: hypothetical protein QGG94_00475, partial [Prochlorococcaceae cyanobacterium ETNP1_MAG_9]|nr:hypothetical protein [Prochlorococcaceae cyanobacterium ETNP1_MAG_9]
PSTLLSSDGPLRGILDHSSRNATITFQPNEKRAKRVATEEFFEFFKISKVFILECFYLF